MKKKQQKQVVTAVFDAVHACLDRNEVKDVSLRNTLLSDLATKLQSTATAELSDALPDAAATA